MLVATPSAPVLPRLSRFAWLMGLYAENYHAIRRVIDIETSAAGQLVSSVGDGLDLYIDVLARHRFMLELRLSYAFADPVTGKPDPSAYVRVYTDARQAEVTHCYVGQRWQDALGLNASSDTVFAHRLRMNTFLAKWLEYLHGVGHGSGALTSGPLHGRSRTVIA